MLNDIKLEASEELNIEIIFPLIEAQRKLFEDPDSKETKQDSEDLHGLLDQAIQKQHWRLALLLASSPIQVSHEQIAILQKNKEKIITFENLNTLTSFGYFAIHIKDFEIKGSNLNRLVCLKSELTTHMLNLFNKGKSLEEKIHNSIKKHETDQEDKIVIKRKLIINHLKKAAHIDSMTGTEIAKENTLQFNCLLESWLKKINLEGSRYNPLDLILEVFALLVDKGFQYNDGIKTVQLRFHSSKISKKNMGEYRHYGNVIRFGLHFNIHNYDSTLPGIVLHEFIHLLCNLMYGNVSTLYRIELEKLVKSILEYMNCRKYTPDDQGIFTGFSTYPQEKYAEEFFPRLFEFFILKNESPNDLFPSKISLQMQYFFARFLHDVAKFKFKLLEQHQHIPRGRLEMFDYLENKDYKNFFNYITPKNNRGYNFFPSYFSLDSKFLKMAIENKFDLNEPNKLGVTPLKYYIYSGYFDMAVTLLEKLWESKQINTNLINQVDLNQQNKDNKTLLIQAIQMHKSEKFIEWLIQDCKVDTTLVDHSGSSATLYAVSNNISQKIIDLLRQSEKSKGVKSLIMN